MHTKEAIVVCTADCRHVCTASVCLTVGFHDKHNNPLLFTMIMRTVRSHCSQVIDSPHPVTGPLQADVCKCRADHKVNGCCSCASEGLQDLLDMRTMRCSRFWLAKVRWVIRDWMWCLQDGGDKTYLALPAEFAQTCCTGHVCTAILTLLTGWLADAQGQTLC